MMGHAGRESFLSCVASNPPVEYAVHDVASGFSGEPTCPLVIIACSTGDFSGGDARLAEAFFSATTGPAAVIAATTESHPLANYYTGVSLLAALGGADRRIGSIWLAAQRAAHDVSDPSIDNLLADVEGKLEPRINIAKLKRDQILMYELFGDPATPLFLPDRLEASVERRGESWHWRAVAPAGAERLSVGFRVEDPLFQRGICLQSLTGCALHSRPPMTHLLSGRPPFSRRGRHGKGTRTVQGFFAWWPPARAAFALPCSSCGARPRPLNSRNSLPEKHKEG